MRIIGMPGAMCRAPKLVLTALLRDEGLAVSESTVGRILSHLLRRGEVPLSPVRHILVDGGRRHPARLNRKKAA